MSERVMDDDLRAYDDRRAAEYDDWWLGTGRFVDRDRPGWADEVEELVAVLAALPPARVLDVACGTAFLTRHLRGEVTAIDQSPRMVEIAARRMPAGTVLQGDAVPPPFADAAFERVVTSHFYGHLQPEEREPFVAEVLMDGGWFVVVAADEFCAAGSS
jgi:SAM-dependent methyltransferase